MCLPTAPAPTPLKQLGGLHSTGKTHLAQYSPSGICFSQAVPQIIAGCNIPRASSLLDRESRLPGCAYEKTFACLERPKVRSHSFRVPRMYQAMIRLETGSRSTNWSWNSWIWGSAEHTRRPSGGCGPHHGLLRLLVQKGACKATEFREVFVHSRVEITHGQPNAHWFDCKSQSLENLVEALFSSARQLRAISCLWMEVTVVSLLLIINFGPCNSWIAEAISCFIALLSARKVV